MHLGLITGGDGWHVRDLQRAAVALGHTAHLFDFRSLSAIVPSSSTDALFKCDALIVRTMPAGSLEQVVFRMDLLHTAASLGVRIINSPRSLETAIDKYLTTVRLAHAGLPVPRTWCGQRADDAMLAFEQLGGDVVVKPLFGSEGRGMMRVSDPELAWRTFHTIERTQAVLYLQSFIRHPGYDVRAFVLGDRIIASMRRYSRNGWRTNIAQGGYGEPFALNAELESLAIRGAQAVGAVAAGVDLLPGPDGEWYVLEVNAVPGWRRLTDVTNIDIARELIAFAALR